MIFLPLLVFLLGLIIGSFLNVVVLRMNTGRTALQGRSACARCSAPLHWYDLIPVFSFLGLRGKCRSCKGRISFQYPLVELVTAIAFTIIYTNVIFSYGFTALAGIVFLFSIVIAALLIVIFAYDLRHMIIPDTMVYVFILLSLGAVVWRWYTVSGISLGVELFNGVLVALPFFLIWAISKGKAMGFGDVKLALGMGWLLGLVGGFSAILFAFWMGGLVGLFILSLSRKHTVRSEIPFAPFLIMGTFIVGVWGITIYSLFSLWQ